MEIITNVHWQWVSQHFPFNNISNIIPQRKSIHYYLLVCPISYLYLLIHQSYHKTYYQFINFRSFSLVSYWVLTFLCTVQCDQQYLWLHLYRISLSASLPLILPSHLLLMFSTESELCQMCTETSTRTTLLLPGRFSDYMLSINTHWLLEALCLSIFFFSLSPFLNVFSSLCLTPARLTGYNIWSIFKAALCSRIILTRYTCTLPPHWRQGVIVCWVLDSCLIQHIAQSSILVSFRNQLASQSDTCH